MIADLYAVDRRPSTAHDLMVMVGAFAHDLPLVADEAIDGEEDERRVVASLADAYLAAGRREMAAHVAGHYERWVACYAALEKMGADALALGLPAPLAHLCRRKRIVVRTAMNWAAHQKVAAAGGRLLDAPGVWFWVYRYPGPPAAPLGRYESLAEAVESVRAAPADGDWRGTPLFVIRPEG